MSQAQGSQKTNTSNEQYNLISVLYHALEGAQTYAKYVTDAQGDQELSQFFQQAQQEELQRAEKAKQLLAKRLG